MAKPASQSILANEISTQYNRDFSNLSPLRDTWQEKEAILLGIPLDSGSKESKSKVFDPRLSTIVFERASRVCAQTP